jgi:NAD(P)H-hydrate epimerase
MAGAISIAGMACLKSGAGLVTLAIPDVVADVVASFHPCFMTIPLPSDGGTSIAASALSTIARAASNANVVALGPGLGRSSELDALVHELFQSATCPLVLDADGINALRLSSLPKQPASVPFPPPLTTDASLIRMGEGRRLLAPRILTPHPGEFATLTGVSAKHRSDQIAAATALSRERHWIVVLKGHETLVVDHERSYINRTGNPRMAVGGAGDCLTGIITALIAQGMPAYEAAVLGVCVHGRAGDIAAEKIPGPSVLATDIIDCLPWAFQWAATEPRMA